eukprot:768043-Hanusia_phi.AAC.1
MRRREENEREGNVKIRGELRAFRRYMKTWSQLRSQELKRSLGEASEELRKQGAGQEGLGSEEALRYLIPDRTGQDGATADPTPVSNRGAAPTPDHDQDLRVRVVGNRVGSFSRTPASRTHPRLRLGVVGSVESDDGPVYTEGRVVTGCQWSSAEPGVVGWPGPPGCQ